MNTPKTRDSRRYGKQRPPGPNNPDGRYSSGLWNEKFALLIGQLATYWPLVEDKMIGILGDLLGYAALLGEKGRLAKYFGRY
jgi:hypothetical protein